jgi:shikimate dehydrogenase
MRGRAAHPDAATTVRAALIGRGISASLTPAMHEAEAAAIGFSYRYDLFDTDTAQFSGLSLAQILHEAQASEYSGVNVTHPFKVAVMPLLDKISEQSKIIGAANTVLFRSGKQYGYNTDYTGFKTALRVGLKGVSLDNVLVLGAGGAGPAVALALIDSGASSLSLYDKDLERSRIVAGRLSKARPGVRIAAIPDLLNKDLTTFDGVVNTTPMGMKNHPGTAIDPAALMPSTWVADIVYFPLETELLLKARANGCTVLNGSGMAIYQAAAAFELITGRTPDTERFVEKFERLRADGSVKDTKIKEPRQ